jgi:DNA-binding transcriptional regulator YhcF (GntR family)
MRFEIKSDKPIFIQFAEELENGILKGIFAEGSQIPSINEVAVRFKINPATANRGVNLLVEEGVVYKKRGVGMFVSPGARDLILSKRKKAFLKDFIKPLLSEADSLGITKQEIILLIEGGISGEQD